jgi:hypothetical protein
VHNNYNKNSQAMLQKQVKKEKDIESNLGKVLKILPELHSGKKDASDCYVDVNEDMLGACFLISCMISSDIFKDERVKVTDYLGNEKRVHFYVYQECKQLRRFHVSMGNGNNIHIPHYIYLIHGDNWNRIYSFICRVRTLCHQIFKNPEVALRWLLFPITVKHLKNLLNKVDVRVSIRETGIAFYGKGYLFSTVGDWLVACFNEYVKRTKQDINLRQVLEILCILCVNNVDEVFNDILTYTEGWLVFGNCVSCLRRVLRAADKAGKIERPYPYSFWETRLEKRSVSVDGASFKWVAEKHGNNVTLGKTIAILGEHDFLVLDSSTRFLTVNIKDEDVGSYKINIEAIYFDSVHRILDGYYRHVRSIILDDSDIGLITWKELRCERTQNFFLELLKDFNNIGQMGLSSLAMRKLCDHLRVWILSGKVSKQISGQVENNKDDDIYSLVLISLLRTEISASLEYEYTRISSILHSKMDLKKIFFLGKFDS